MTIEAALRRERLKALSLPEPTSVPSGTSLRETLGAMRSAGGGAILISRGGRVAGIFTERDVLNKLFKGPVDESKPVDGFMTSNPKALTPDATLAEAVRLMTEHGYRNVPLVDAEGRIAGMVTARHIVEYIAEHFPTEVANMAPSLEQEFKTPEGA